MTKKSKTFKSKSQKIEKNRYVENNRKVKITKKSKNPYIK